MRIFDVIEKTVPVEEVAQLSKFADSGEGIYDVAIVGAGPVGLSTAVGLRDRNINNILVLDRTRAFRQVGQIVDVLSNGLKALKYIAPQAYEAVRLAAAQPFQPGQTRDRRNPNQTTDQIPEKTPDKIAAETVKAVAQSLNRSQSSSQSSARWVYRDFQGNVLRAISLDDRDWVRQYGEGRSSLTWYNLQTALRQLLPPEQVKANHRCLTVVEEPDAGCVRVECVTNAKLEANPYAHWSEQLPEQTSAQTETRTFRARLVVAADGINSTIRQVLSQNGAYANQARPEYSGFAAILCMQVGEIPDDLWAEIEQTFFQDAFVVSVCSSSTATTAEEAIAEETVDDTAGPRILMFRRGSGQRGYIIHAPIPLVSLQGRSGASSLELALQELEKAGFPDSLLEFVRLSPPEDVKRRPYYIHRAKTGDAGTDGVLSKELPWHQGRVVLAGDSAHGMPPFMAQGANQGLEDAAVLVAAIAHLNQTNQWHNPQAIAAAFSQYERLRRPLVARIQQATLSQTVLWSEAQWQAYNQQVYGRDFEQIVMDFFAGE